MNFGMRQDTGGTLAIRLESEHVLAGGLLRGEVVFSNGMLPTDVESICVTVHCNVSQDQETEQGTLRTCGSVILVPRAVLASAFLAAPGAVHRFAFSCGVPGALGVSQPGVCDYRISAAVEIEHGIGPGTGADFVVVERAAETDTERSDGR